MAIFRIKFAYKADNQETGSIDKVKSEVLAQCVNYTDAEALAVKLIELEEMSKYEPADYEIIRQKFSHADLELSDKVMNFDTEALVNGLVEHYFIDADSQLYLTKAMLPYIDDNGNEKFTKLEAYVSAKSAVEAINYFRKVLVNRGDKGFSFKQVKAENVNAIYLCPETHAQVFNRQVKYDEL